VLVVQVCGDKTDAQRSVRVGIGREGGAGPRAFKVEAMPSSYLVDRQGRIVEIHRGFTRDDVAARRQAVLRVLEQQP
jgi:peroxiredoxin